MRKDGELMGNSAFLTDSNCVEYDKVKPSDVPCLVARMFNQMVIWEKQFKEAILLCQMAAREFGRSKPIADAVKRLEEAVVSLGDAEERLSELGDAVSVGRAARRSAATKTASAKRSAMIGALLREAEKMRSEAEKIEVEAIEVARATRPRLVKASRKKQKRPTT